MAKIPFKQFCTLKAFRCACDQFYWKMFNTASAKSFLEHLSNVSVPEPSVGEQVLNLYHPYSSYVFQSVKMFLTTRPLEGLSYEEAREYLYLIELLCDMAYNPTSIKGMEFFTPR